MREINYTITDDLGIHARPAGLLVKTAAQFQSTVQIEKGGKRVDGKKIFGLMSLGAKCGDEIAVSIEGPDEDQAAEALEGFLRENL